MKPNEQLTDHNPVNRVKFYMGVNKKGFEHVTNVHEKKNLMREKQELYHID